MRLEIKLLIAIESFSIQREFIDKTLLPALGVTGANLEEKVYTFDALRKQVLATPLLCRPYVFNRYTLDSYATEIDELLINGAAFGSIAVE